MKIEYLRNGNVVSLHSARRATRFPSIAQVEAYWHGLRNGRLCPTRNQIDPRGMAGALHEAFILEKIAPGLARIRLAGQHLNDILDMEVRGMPISAFFLPDARKEMHRALEALFDMPAQITLSLSTEAGPFRKPHEAQMVMLPLRDNAGQITRVLGAMQANGDLKRGPQRFAIRAVEVTPIVVDTDTPPATAMSQKAYQDGQNAMKQTQDVLDMRLTSTPAPSSGHVFREPSKESRAAFREFTESLRQLEPHRRCADTGTKRSHLKLVTSD